MLVIQSLETIFENSIKKLSYQESTKAYITNVFCSVNKKKYDYSNESVTLIYSQAKFEYRFELFQALADWILFSDTLFPESLNGGSEDYYQAVARDSYYRCYKMINRKWPVFEELADQFPQVVRELRSTDFVGPLRSNSLFR